MGYSVISRRDTIAIETNAHDLDPTYYWLNKQKKRCMLPSNTCHNSLLNVCKWDLNTC